MTKPLYTNEDSDKEIPNVVPEPSSKRRSIRDIPLSPRKQAELEAETNKQSKSAKSAITVAKRTSREQSIDRESTHHSIDIKRDVEPVPDLTEEELRLEQPLEHAEKVEHIQVDFDNKPKKIKTTKETQAQKKTKRRMHDMKHLPENHTFDSFPTNQKVRHSTKYRGTYAFILLLLVVVFALWTTVFAKATIVVSAPTQEVSFASTVLPNPIPYDSFNKNYEKKVTVNNIGTVAVEKKATGKIIIYNNFSTEPYELIATTRFQTANGSVYKLLEDLKVPGKKGDTPGSIEAKVEADKPGEEYNARGGLELKLPGLIPGTLKYVNIYAKTAANFIGGETGTAPNTSSKEILSAVTAAVSDFKAQAIAEYEKTHSDKIIIQDSISATHSLGDIVTKDSKSEVPIKVTIKAVALDKNQLLESINTSLKDKQVVVSSEALAQLQYEVNKTSNSSLLAGTFSISVSGTVQANSMLTKETIKSLVAGKDAVNANKAIVESNPQATTEISIMPFWKSSIPQNKDKISVIIK